MSTEGGARITYANVVSSLCLVLALGGGTAYAVTQLDRDSVKSKHIVDGQVKSADVQDEAIGASKVEDNSLTGQQINESTLVGIEDERLTTLRLTVPKPANPGDANEVVAFPLGTGLSIEAICHNSLGDARPFFDITRDPVASPAVTYFGLQNGEDLNRGTLSGPDAGATLNLGFGPPNQVQFAISTTDGLELNGTVFQDAPANAECTFNGYAVESPPSP